MERCEPMACICLALFNLSTLGSCRLAEHCSLHLYIPRHREHMFKGRWWGRECSWTAMYVLRQSMQQCISELDAIGCRWYQYCMMQRKELPLASCVIIAAAAGQLSRKILNHANCGHALTESLAFPPPPSFLPRCARWSETAYRHSLVRCTLVVLAGLIQCARFVPSRIELPHARSDSVPHPRVTFCTAIHLSSHQRRSHLPRRRHRIVPGAPSAAHPSCASRRCHPSSTASADDPGCQ